MIDLDKIRARWAKSTRGPWRLFFDGEGFDKHTREVTIARNRKGGVTTDWVVTNTTMGIDDARAIAAAPSDIAALLSELDRLTAALAAAQAAPVVEWREDVGFSHARIGRFWMVVRRDGWRLELSQPFSSTPDLVEGGPETGPAGKAAAEAAYRRACGLPAIPACAG